MVVITMSSFTITVPIIFVLIMVFVKIVVLILFHNNSFYKNNYHKINLTTTTALLTVFLSMGVLTAPSLRVAV
jgi:hypothetical protein